MRLVGRLLGIFVVVIVVLLGVGLAVGKAKLDTTYDIPPQQLTLSEPIASADVQHGRHFVMAITSCVDCHGAHLQGTVFLDVPPFRIVAPNLTRGNGGIGGTFTDADFIRAIRHGVGPDGRGLIVMPSSDYTHLSDRDLADIIAYVKSVPAVDNVLPPTDLRPLGLLLLAAGQAPAPNAASIDHTAAHPTTIEATVTPRYGEYIANIAGCVSCHGAGLSGGKIPGLPPDAPQAQNITPAGIGNWSQADFTRALRVGVRPDGSTINSLMPWSDYTRMTDAEIGALWLYIHSVPPRPSSTH